MDKTFTAEVAVSAESAGEVLAELDHYPKWMDVVHSASPVEDGQDGQDEGRRWDVTLRAALGPLARSKRLRMRRTLYRVDANGSVALRFERHEDDGRQHAPWTMAASATPKSPTTSVVAVTLTYEGSLWSTALNGLLDGVAADGTANLQRYLLEREATRS